MNEKLFSLHSIMFSSSFLECLNSLNCLKQKQPGKNVESENGSTNFRNLWVAQNIFSFHSFGSALSLLFFVEKFVIKFDRGIKRHEPSSCTTSQIHFNCLGSNKV